MDVSTVEIVTAQFVANWPISIVTDRIDLPKEKNIDVFQLKIVKFNLLAVLRVI